MRKGIALSLDGAPDSTDLYSIKARGADCVRFEAFPGMTSGLLPFLHETGLSLVLLLSRALCPQYTNADWNSTGAAFTAVCDTWQRAVQAVLATVAEHAPLDYLELWNEPDGNIGGVADTGLHPWNFAHLYRAAHDVIVHEHPTAKVISGGLFAHATSGAEYLRAALQVFPLQFDAIGWHPYLSIGTTLDTTLLTTYLAELRAVRDAPVWITETGWAVNQVTPVVQDANLRSLFATCRQSGQVEGVLVFTLRDAPTAVPPLYYGLYDRISWWNFPQY